jgi:hypothetical protein
MTKRDYPQIEVASRAALRLWLDENHVSAGPQWLVTG